LVATGNLASADPLSAVLDDVRVYGSALDAAGVAALYAVVSAEPTGSQQGARDGAVPVARPGTPVYVSVAAGEGSLRVTWAPPVAADPQVVGYVVQYREESAVVWVTAARTSADARSHTIGGLVGGKKYLVQVAARGESGVGAWLVSRPVLPSGR
jgi:hypothetical protein